MSWDGLGTPSYTAWIEDLLLKPLHKLGEFVSVCFGKFSPNDQLVSLVFLCLAEQLCEHVCPPFCTLLLT